MKNLIDAQITIIKQSSTIGLMTHMVLGYPNKDIAVPLIETLACHSDFVELQIPFSDPIADGPTIMYACDRALRNGVTIEYALQTMRIASRNVTIPLLFMCYFNSIYHYGTAKFCKEAHQAGAAGLIVPDIPPEEDTQEQFTHHCKEHNLHCIRVLSPASSPQRIRANANHAQGFVYCVSQYGVTGTQATIDTRLQTYINRVKEHINLPIAVGFGISQREHVQALHDVADIAVVGSAILKQIDEHNDERSLQNVEQCVQSLRSDEIKRA